MQRDTQQKGDQYKNSLGPGCEGMPVQFFATYAAVTDYAVVKN